VITFYDNCKLCCLKDESHPAYGITASGERARRGYVACNWLPFGTVLEVEGLGVFTVKDRGARSLFGTPKNPIKHIDVWVPSHAEARKLGKQIRRVALLNLTQTIHNTQ
jgi:3D (Asp-Asp-Asp) domain-containing protein